MHLRGTGRAHEPGTMQGVHDLIHTLLEQPDILAAVNAALKARKHQAISYGALPSGLHLHYLCHALGKDWPIYVSVDGYEALAGYVYQRRDKIGRMDQAIVIESLS